MQRLVIYLCVAALSISLIWISPSAWATPGQSRPGQTVPTPTPTGAELPTATSVPQRPQPPAATPLPPPPEPTAEAQPPTPEPVSSPTATRRPAPALILAKEVDRREAWPGVTLHYTLTLINLGDASAREVHLTEVLPDGLDPGAQVLGEEAVWEGRMLRASVTILPPGTELVVGFSAIVRADAVAGSILVNRAEASAADGSRAEASIWVALPPAELPPTGQSNGGTEDQGLRIR